MSGFAHDVAGGSGNLVAAQVQSPNFEHGVSGWIIRKDGSAEFQDVIIGGGGTGITATFSATAPASPATGDLWYDTSDGLLLSQWDGSAWVAYQIGTGAIDAGAITATQLAAGIVYAGIVDSTTVNAATFTGSVFEGTDFVINAAGQFFYSATPAAGNLTESVARTAGTDALGNHYVAGHATYGATFAASLAAGFMVMYTGSLPGGWTQTATVETSSLGDLVLFASNVISLAGDVSIGGTLTLGSPLPVSGSSSSAGLPDGTIHGTSGGASAGTSHTHGPGSFAVGNG
ncbi:MAG TPA: hypothetical protein VFX70_08150, partial [Mycobacteriales bacterium]|nr:hypothetical protein [Mycobacteriales bacterium]